MVVLDPFCGSGTTLAVADKLGRRWIGIDKNALAIELADQRLRALGQPPSTIVSVKRSSRANQR
jgi:DNA modification methylase